MRPISIRIPQGNSFVLHIPLVRRSYIGGRAVDVPVDIMKTLTGISVTVERLGESDAYTHHVVDSNVIAIAFPAGLPTGVYSIRIAATDTVSGAGVTSAYKDAFSIVGWNIQSNWTDFVPGSPILLPAIPYVDAFVVPTMRYDKSAKVITLYIGEQPISTLDATDFIKDGMVSDVEVVGKNIVITFNTDAEKRVIEVPTADIFNPDNYYQKTAVDDKNAALQEQLTRLRVDVDSLLPEQAEHEAEVNIQTVTYDNVAKSATWRSDDASVSVTQVKGTSSSSITTSAPTQRAVKKGQTLILSAVNEAKIVRVEIVCQGNYVGDSMTFGTVQSGNTVINDENITTRLTGSTLEIELPDGGVETLYIQNVASQKNVDLRFTAITITYKAKGEQSVDEKLAALEERQKEHINDSVVKVYEALKSYENQMKEYTDGLEERIEVLEEPQQQDSEHVDALTHRLEAMTEAMLAVAAGKWVAVWDSTKDEDTVTVDGVATVFTGSPKTAVFETSISFRNSYLKKMYLLVWKPTGSQLNYFLNKIGDSQTDVDLTGLRYLDTSAATQMTWLFEARKTPGTMEQLADWDTSKVTTMAYLWLTQGRDLTPLAGWNTGRVTNFANLMQAASMKSLDGVKDWDMSSVTSMSECFSRFPSEGTMYQTYDDAELYSLDKLKDWKLPKLKNLTRLFNMSILTNVDVLDEWQKNGLENVTNINYLCYSSTGLVRFPTLDCSKVTQATYAFTGCDSLRDFGGLPGMKVSISLNASSRLTLQSIVNLITSLAGLSDAETHPTLSLHRTAFNRAVEDTGEYNHNGETVTNILNLATAKGWNVGESL